MIDWPLTAELLSVASGAALSWPALRINQCLRQAHNQQRKAETERSKKLKELRRALATAYSSSNWNPVDHALTLTGVGLLIVSSLIKVCIEW